MILDPLPTGVTSVTGVDFYPDAARTEPPVAAPVSLVDGQWTVDTLNVPAGRWWPTVHAMKGATPYDYPRVLVDLPEDDRLIISPESVAAKMKLPLPLTDDQRETLTEAILDAQSGVETYLGQPVMPREFVQRGLYDYGDSWDLDTDLDVIRVVSATAETDINGDATGTFTVTFIAGLNARDDAALRPIRRYVTYAALSNQQVYDLWIEVVKPKREIKSSSAEGQSVSYEKPLLVAAGNKPGEAGAPPTLGSLDYWRIAGRRVHQARTRFGAYEPS